MVNVLRKLINQLLVMTLVTFAANVYGQQTIKVINTDGKPIVGAVVAIPDSRTVKQVHFPNAVMDQIDRQFLPQLLVITKGQSVHFPNSDNIRHHVYSFSETKPFEIKLYKGINTEPVMFDKPGIVVLGCNIHDNMLGHIYVADDEIALITDAKGEVTFESDSPSFVSVWHPKLSLAATKKVDVSVEYQEGIGRVILSTIEPILEKPKRTFGGRTFGDNN